MVFSIYRHSFSVIPVLQGEEHKLSLPRPDQAANAREEIAGEPSSSEPHAVSTWKDFYDCHLHHHKFILSV